MPTMTKPAAAKKRATSLRPRPKMEFRLSDEDLRELKRMAHQAKKPLGTFGREALLGVLGQEGQRHEELVARLMVLEQAVADLRTGIEESLSLVNRLCMASIVSSALLKDDGKASDQEANKQILAHIAESIELSPGLLKHHAK